MSDPNPVDSVAPEPKLTVFISYVREDSVISTALNNALQNAFGKDISVFVDRVSIQQGDPIRQTIQTNLAKSDVLAIISTGVERPSFDWAGFELGFFAATHTESRPDRPMWGKVVTLAAPGAEPRPANDVRYIPMEVDPALLAMSEDAYGKSVSVPDDDPLLVWFAELHRVVYGENLSTRKLDQDSYEVNIRELKRRIFAEYRRRPKSIVRPQKQLAVRYRLDPTTLGLMPDDATITFHGGAASVFGLADGAINPMAWRQFCDALAQYPHGAFSVLALTELLQSAGTLGLLEMNRGVIASRSERQLFRLLLTTSTTFFDDWVEANVYLIEVYQREEHGNPHTTLLLKGLQLVSRFRFLFLEEQSKFHYLNIKSSDVPQLRETARKIVRELDLLKADSLDAHLDKPADWTLFLSEDQLETMAATWRPLQEELLESCRCVIKAPDDAAVTAARDILADVLKRMAQQVRPHNQTILRSMANSLAEIAGDTHPSVSTPLLKMSA